MALGLQPDSKDLHLPLHYPCTFETISSSHAFVAARKYSDPVSRIRVERAGILLLHQSLARGWEIDTK